MLSKNLLKAAIALSGVSLSPFLFGAQPERPGFWGKEYEAESKSIPQAETSAWEWHASTVEIFSADGQFEEKGVNFRFSQISELDEKSGLSSEFALNVGIGSEEWSELKQIRIPVNLKLGFRKTIDDGFSVYAGIFGGADLLYWDPDEFYFSTPSKHWAKSERYLGIGLQIGVKFGVQYQFDESHAVTFSIGFDRNIERIGTSEDMDYYTEGKTYRTISIGYRRFF